MTKGELRQHRREIRSLRLEIYQLEDANAVRRARAMRVTTTITDEPRGGSIIHDTMAEMVTVIVDKDRDVVCLSMQIEQIAAEIEMAIADLNAIERYTMRCYYIECMTWNRVALLSNYCETRIFEIHGEALNHMAAKERSKTELCP